MSIQLRICPCDIENTRNLLLLRENFFVGIILSSFKPENIELLYTNSHSETLEKDILQL